LQAGERADHIINSFAGNDPAELQDQVFVIGKTENPARQ
jgi:hypothetical protein